MVISIGLAATPLPAAAVDGLVDGIAAQVGSEIVLVSEVAQLAGRLERELRQAGAPQTEIAKLNATVLERLIEWRLIERVVRQAELEATEAEVDAAIAGIARENELTLDQLRQSVLSHDLSYEEYRDKLRHEIERARVIDLMVRSRVHVEDQEVLGLYERRYADQPTGGEQVHLRQILIPSGSGAAFTQQTACELLADIEAQIRSGKATFADLARRFSAVNRELGGDIGWVHTTMLASWMSEAVSRLEPDEMSSVIGQPFGCTLLQLVERKAFEPITLKQARPELEQELFNERMQEEYSQWMEKLRKSTYIERKGFFADAAEIVRPPRTDDADAQP